MKKASEDLIAALSEGLKEKFNASLSKEQIYRYIARVRKDIQVINSQEGVTKVQWYVAYLLKLLAKCREKGDYKAELNVLKELAEVEGIYPAKNINLSGEIDIKDFDPNKLTRSQLERIVAGEAPAVVIASYERSN